MTIRNTTIILRSDPKDLNDDELLIAIEHREREGLRINEHLAQLEAEQEAREASKKTWSVNDGDRYWYIRASSDLNAAKRAAKELGASRVVQRDPVLFTASILDPTGFFGGTREISLYVHEAPSPLEGL
jgi:hypothetical protein